MAWHGDGPREGWFQLQVVSGLECRTAGSGGLLYIFVPDEVDQSQFRQMVAMLRLTGRTDYAIEPAPGGEVYVIPV